MSMSRAISDVKDMYFASPLNQSENRGPIWMTCDMPQPSLPLSTFPTIRANPIEQLEPTPKTNGTKSSLRSLTDRNRSIRLKSALLLEARWIDLEAEGDMFLAPKTGKTDGPMDPLRPPYPPPESSTAVPTKPTTLHVTLSLEVAHGHLEAVSDCVPLTGGVPLP